MESTEITLLSKHLTPIKEITPMESTEITPLSNVYVCMMGGSCRFRWQSQTKKIDKFMPYHATA